ncbi:TMEM175 family protein [Furfurilactobacillus entadae]|uniref:TMEM175 family protein n=1 Tax=Furfurilactobacillus entadae TaxID=2922307 RepID=UPI0035E7C328
MSKARIEAFTDGVMAIIITILVLDIHLPEQHTWASLGHVAIPMIAYVVSFLLIANSWNHHHQMFATAKRVDGTVMWANINLLFWMSLLPAVTAWFGEDIFAQPSGVLYAALMIPFNLSFIWLNHAVQHANDNDSHDGISKDSDRRELTSLGINVIAVLVTIFFPPFALADIAFNSLLWLRPLREHKHK